MCLCNNIENAHVAMRLRKSPMLWVGERPPCREREGVVPRLDGLCYDNTNVQVETGEWRGRESCKCQKSRGQKTYATILKIHRWRARRQRKSEMNRNRGKNILMI